MSAEKAAPYRVAQLALERLSKILELSATKVSPRSQAATAQAAKLLAGEAVHYGKLAEIVEGK